MIKTLYVVLATQETCSMAALKWKCLPYLGYLKFHVGISKRSSLYATLCISSLGGGNRIGGHFFLAILQILLYSYSDCENFSSITVQSSTCVSVLCQRILMQFALSLNSFYAFPCTDICCSNLKNSTFGSPDPFLKLCLTCSRGGVKLPHHGQKADTEVIYNTVSPRWNEVIMM